MIKMKTLVMWCKIDFGFLICLMKERSDFSKKMWRWDRIYIWSIRSPIITFCIKKALKIHLVRSPWLWRRYFTPSNVLLCGLISNFRTYKQRTPQLTLCKMKEHYDVWFEDKVVFEVGSHKYIQDMTMILYLKLWLKDQLVYMII